MTNQERRIADLTEQLDIANREINRLVLENNEQDFEIHRLKKLVNIISDERDSLINDLYTTEDKEKVSEMVARILDSQRYQQKKHSRDI